jgi:hypothetical protein
VTVTFSVGLDLSWSTIKLDGKDKYIIYYIY